MCNIAVKIKIVRTSMHDDMSLKSYSKTPRYLIMRYKKFRNLKTLKVLTDIKIHQRTAKILTNEKIFR